MVGKAFPCYHKSWSSFCKFFYRRDLQRLVIYSFIYEEMQNEKKNSVDGDGRVCAYGNVHTLLLVI